MDESISTFVAFTGGTTEQAQRYLQLADGNVEAATSLFFENPDLGAASAAPAQPAPPPHSNPQRPITLDSDDDELDLDDDDVRETGSRPAQQGGSLVEDDEAMARRLQEEMYGGSGSNRGAGAPGLDEDGVRAPMARTTETLVGPGSHDWRQDPGEMQAAIAQQMFNRQHRGAARGTAPGIFNQRSTAAIWNNDDPADPDAHRQALARATGGQSSQSTKSTHLAELFRPPFDLIYGWSFSEARDEGKENEKWILVNVQNPSIFDCQVLNRDIWKNESIRETIKEHFIFLQYNKDDPRGNEFIQYYMVNTRDDDDAYPHIAIIDPRTGEQVKTWSGSPAPKAAEFLMELHEFLDRYSLSMNKKNPVQKQRKESKKDVAAMSEEEMLEMAMQASMANGTGAKKEDDPDALTKSVEFSGKGKAPVGADEGMEVDEEVEASSARAQQDTAFSRISSTNPHEEPTSTGPDTTRIQFRYSGGRVVRRFDLSDTVQRIYEWLKASPIEGHSEAKEFQLISLGKNLMDVGLETTIADANLKQGTVMVEYSDEE